MTNIHNIYVHIYIIYIYTYIYLHVPTTRRAFRHSCSPRPINTHPRPGVLAASPPPSPSALPPRDRASSTAAGTVLTILV